MVIQLKKMYFLLQAQIQAQAQTQITLTEHYAMDSQVKSL